MTPQRIQRKRARGWRAPANTLNVTRPSVFSNPFKMTTNTDAERETVLYWFENIHIKNMDKNDLEHLLSQVRAADYIMCWCPLDKPCHTDIWIRMATK